MNKLDKKISQAKAKLLVEYPFFGTISSRIEFIINDDISSFKSNGIELDYNQEFMKNLSILEMEFVLANSAMHASLSHEARKNNRIDWLWQMATDFAINDMLVQNGMHRPHEARYEKRFEGMYAEEIYAELKEEKLDNLKKIEKSSSSDSPEEKNLEQKSQEITQEQQLFEEFAHSVFLSEQKKGEIPAGIERFFTIENKGSVDWREELKYAIDKFYKDDYTLMPPNKKFLYAGIYLPSSISERFKLVVAIDSSGSIDEELLSVFLSELNFLMSTIPNYEIELLICDDKILSHETFYSGEMLNVDIKGGGGTDFRPVFTYIDENLQDTKLLLYFTDLDGVLPKEEVNYEVKWVVPKELEIPFGESIILTIS